MQVHENIVNQEEVKKGKISKMGWGMILFLFVSMVINYMDKAIIGLASVQLIDELNLSPNQWGLVGSSFFWLFSITGMVGGFLADKYGTKRIMSFMAGSWSIIQFAIVFTVSLPYLIVSRILLGAGEGPAYPVAMASGAKWLPKDKLGIGLTMINLGGNIGVAIATPIIVYIMATAGWRSGFITMAIVGVIWLILWHLFAKESPHLDSIPKVDKKKSAPSFSFAEVRLFLFNKNFILLVLVGFASHWTFAVVLTWLPNYFSSVRHMSEASTGWVWVAQAIAQISFALLSDKIYRKTGSVRKSRVYILGAIAITCGILFYFAPLVSSNIMVVIMFSLSLGLSGVFFVLSPSVIDSFVPPQHRAKGMGTLMAFVTLAGIIGPFVTGNIIQFSSTQAAGFTNSFQFLALLFIVFGTLFWIGCKPDSSLKVQKEELKESVF